MKYVQSVVFEGVMVTQLHFQFGNYAPAYSLCKNNRFLAWL